MCSVVNGFAMFAAFASTVAAQEMTVVQNLCHTLAASSRVLGSQPSVLGSQRGAASARVFGMSLTDSGTRFVSMRKSGGIAKSPYHGSGTAHELQKQRIKDWVETTNVRSLGHLAGNHEMQKQRIKDWVETTSVRNLGNLACNHHETQMQRIKDWVNKTNASKFGTDLVADMLAEHDKHITSSDSGS